MVRLYEDRPRWIYHDELPLIQKRRGGGDYHKLRFWNLIEQQPNTDNPNLPGNRSGTWRPTADGIRFAKGEIVLPKYALIFDNKCLGFEGELVSIRECLPKNFDFREIWGD